MGKRGQVTITASNEPQLKEIYNFVFQSLRASSFDENKVKLLFLYLRCIVRSSSQQFIALKMGIPSLLNERTTIIVNAALFFEHIFTQESGQVVKGVDVWNKSPMATVFINRDEVDIVLRYRHTLVHDNATRAKKVIDNWKKKNNFTDEEAFDKVKGIAISNVKNITRVITEDYGKYKSYRVTLPK